MIDGIFPPLGTVTNERSDQWRSRTAMPVLQKKKGEMRLTTGELYALPEGQYTMSRLQEGFEMDPFRHLWLLETRAAPTPDRNRTRTEQPTEFGQVPFPTR